MKRYASKTRYMKKVIKNPNSSLDDYIRACRYFEEATVEDEFSFKTEDLGSKEIPCVSEKLIYEAYEEYRVYTYYEEY
jgi:hypothetical protein